MTWSDALMSTRYRWALAFCTVTLTLIVLYMPAYYLQVIQPKRGFIPWDPVLDILPPIELSLATFTILYIAALQTVITAFRKPDLFILGLSTYSVVSLIRPVTMFLLTFEPPADMILLVDPITSFLVYPDNTFAKDLFFSGHVSTLTVMVLVEPNKVARWAKIAATTVVGLFLVWQHVHYTIDLLVAPLVTYGVFVSIKGSLGTAGGDGLVTG